MNTLRHAASALAAALGLLATGSAAAQQVQQAQSGSRIAYVAIERLFSDSKQAKAADARIMAEFSGREKSNQDTYARLKKLSEKFDADAPSLVEPERTRRAREVLELDKEIQRRGQAYRDDLLQRKSEERATIAEKAYTVIGRIAEQENIDVVFRDALWWRPGIDITDKIIKQLDQ